MKQATVRLLPSDKKIFSDIRFFSVAMFAFAAHCPRIASDDYLHPLDLSTPSLPTPQAISAMGTTQATPTIAQAPNTPNEGDGNSLNAPPTAPTLSPVRYVRFGVGCAEASFVSSGVDGTVYDKWLLEMVEVDPTHLEDLTEGLVRRLRIKDSFANCCSSY